MKPSPFPLGTASFQGSPDTWEPGWAGCVASLSLSLGVSEMGPLLSVPGVDPLA